MSFAPEAYPRALASMRRRQMMGVRDGPLGTQTEGNFQSGTGAVQGPPDLNLILI